MKKFATHFFSFLGVCLSVLFGSSISYAATILTNGSFELPVVPTGSFTSLPVGSPLLTGWAIVGPAGTQVAPVSGSFSQNGVTFPAQDGAQWLDLTGNGSNSTEGVSQSVGTVIGDRYELTLYVGNTTGGGIFGTTSTVNVLVNGVQTFSDVNSTVSPTAQNWQQFSHVFVATGTTTTLAFLNGDPSGDNNNGLDNVVLSDLGPVVGAIPEPETYAMLLSGLGVLAFTIRRKKKRAA
jgi:hypothetical protein